MRVLSLRSIKSALLVATLVIFVACQATSPAGFAALPTSTPVEAVSAFVNNDVVVGSIATPIQSKVALPSLNLMSVEGNLVITGSATVFPLMEAMDRRFIREGFRGQISLTSTSTGDAFKTLCSGQSVDVVMASRPINAAETKSCLNAGRFPVEFMVGLDQLSIFVNSENTFIRDVTEEQLQALFSQERWSQVNPDWPDTPINRYISDDQSGTFATFIQDIFKGNPTSLLAATNLTRSTNPTSLVLGVSNDIDGIGFTGRAFTLAYKDRLNVVAINGVLPGTDASKYKLTRPLFLYTDLYALRARSGLAAFINFVLLNVDKEIQAVGYLSGGQAALDESKARFLNVIQGDLLVMGSTTVTPLALSAQSALTTTNYTGYVVVSGVGSGAGFTAFCDKLTSQVAMLSREMSEDEIQKCIKKGRQPIQFRAGSDAFSIVINSRNKFLKNVTIAEFKAIYAAERWSQVNPEWPNERIDHFISDPSTGGFSLIADVIYGGDQKTPLAGPNLRTTFSGVETAERVSQNEYSIGVMAYTFYQQYKDTLQIVTLNGIEPSLENIENGAYKLSRPLNLFSDATIIRNRPQTAAYLYVFLSNLNEDTKRLGYFAPSQRINDENIAKLIKAMQRPESVKP